MALLNNHGYVCEYASEGIRHEQISNMDKTQWT
jgi:hypothetical protein